MSDETVPPEIETGPTAEEPGPSPSPGSTEPDLASVQAELAAVKDQLLRALADVQNTQRRAEKQISDARQYAVDRFAFDLLSVADNLARAIAAAPTEDRDHEPLRTLLVGVEMTEKALQEAFARHGLRRIDAAGEPFDPNVHQAVAQIPSTAPPGSVAEVMQVGYRLNDRTLRAAMVAVSLGPPAGNAQGPDDSQEGAQVDITV